MQKPLEVTFRDVERNDNLLDLIEDEVNKLEKIHDNLIGGSLAVEKPHKHCSSGLFLLKNRIAPGMVVP